MSIFGVRELYQSWFAGVLNDNLIVNQGVLGALTIVVPAPSISLPSPVAGKAVSGADYQFHNRCLRSNVLFINLHPLACPWNTESLRQVRNHMKVDDSLHYLNFLHRIRCMLLDQGGVTIVTKELEMFHLLYVRHHLKFLCEVVTHSLLDTVTTGHVPTHSSLQNTNVVFNHLKKFSDHSHPEISLNDAGCLAKHLQSAANNQTSQSFLNFLGTNVKSQILLTLYSTCDPT